MARISFDERGARTTDSADYTSPGFPVATASPSSAPKVNYSDPSYKGATSGITQPSSRLGANDPYWSSPDANNWQPSTANPYDLSRHGTYNTPLSYWQYLQSQNISGQQATDYLNQSFGSQPNWGTGAAWYPSTGEKGTVGLPTGYISYNGPNGWTWTDRGPEGAGGGANQFGYDDASAQQYLSSILTRISQLKQPQDTQIYDLLKSLSLNRVDDLKGAPYTAGDEAAMRAHYLEPLTTARDQALTVNRENASRAGYLPSSGLLAHNDTAVQQGYQKAVGQAANDTALKAIDEKNRRADQQLSILGNLLGVNNTQTDRSNALQDEIVTLSKLFPDFDQQRLAALLQASGQDTSASALNSFTNLGGLNLRTQQTNTQNAQQNSAAWGQFLYWIAQNL